MTTAPRHGPSRGLSDTRSRFEPARLQVASYVEKLHRLAAAYKGRGVFVVASFGENPTTGAKLPPWIEHFDIGRVRGMTEAIIRFSCERHRNVYAPAAIFKHSLRGGRKGTEADILAVLGVVAHIDDIRAGRRLGRLAVEPNFILRTSSGRSQEFFFFERPLHPEDAKPIAVALRDFADCDFGTSDLSHVWRVPGTWNWPNHKKVSEGRSPNPQFVKVVYQNRRPISASQLASALKTSARDDTRQDVAAGRNRPRQRLGMPSDVKRRLAMKLPEGERSEHAFSIIRQLVEHGWTDTEIGRELYGSPAGERYANYKTLLADISRCRHKGHGNVRKLQNIDRDANAASPPAMPQIEISGGSLSRAAIEGEAALIKAGLPVFRRGQTLVRPVIEEVDATHGRRTNVVHLTEVTPPYLQALLCQSAEFHRLDPRGDAVQIDPPKDMANLILAKYGDWQFRPITGVLSTPTMRPDGSLLIEPGYDAKTSLYLMNPPSMKAVRQDPDREHALNALRFLSKLFCEFPFADKGASLSVALSEVITLVNRAAFRNAPMHSTTAPTAGTGKSYVHDVSSAIALGHPCPVIAAGRTDEETEKRIGAALMAGQSIICLDNCTTELGGDALCQAIERPVVEIRILGQSKLVRIETYATFLASGNNLRIRGDATRRTLMAVLDANMERPELRRFRNDPVATVLSNRGEYIRAALTVARAYFVAGRPNLAPRLVSFEGWSDTVRSALIWLGQEDPVATMEIARREDPELQALRAFYAAIRDEFGTGPQNSITASEMIAKATVTPVFNDVLLAIVGHNNHVDGRNLGKWLSRYKGRIVDGLRLEGRGDKHGHAMQWWLE